MLAEGRQKEMSLTGGVVHLNSHRNKIIMFRYKVRCRYKQSNWRKGVPHGPFWIIIREVLFFGQVVAQLVTEGINATLCNNLKRSQGIVRNKSGIKLLKGLCRGSPVHFCLILPTTRPQSLWKQRNYL